MRDALEEPNNQLVRKILLFKCIYRRTRALTHLFTVGRMVEWRGGVE